MNGFWNKKRCSTPKTGLIILYRFSSLVTINLQSKAKYQELLTLLYSVSHSHLWLYLFLSFYRLQLYLFLLFKHLSLPFSLSFVALSLSFLCHLYLYLFLSFYPVYSFIYFFLSITWCFIFYLFLSFVALSLSLFL